MSRDSYPEAEFLQGLPGAPSAQYRPTSLRMLAHKKGLAKAHRTPHAMATGYWDEWLRLVPQGREWFNSPKALHVIKHWPGWLAELMPDHITPKVWWEGYRPRKAVWTVQGDGVISMMTVGWQPTPSQKRAAVGAMVELWSLPQFVIWAYDLELESIPLPMTGTSVDLAKKLKARRDLEHDPLRWGHMTICAALPEHMRSTPALLAHCRRRSKSTSRSSRQAVLLPGGRGKFDFNRWRRERTAERRKRR